MFHNNIGVALFGVGRHDEAREAFRAASRIWAETDLEDSPDALNTLNNWGALEVTAGHLDQAEPLFGKAVELRQRLFGPSAATAALLNNSGKLLLKTGRPAQALPLLRDAAAMGAQYAGHGSVHHIAALSGVADAELALDRLEAAAATAEQALALARGKLGDAHPGAASPRLSMARVRIRLGRAADAAVWLVEVDGIAAGAGAAGNLIAAQSGSLRAQIAGRPPAR